ncbi:MAG: right-handed parallel beta-helix repeat-containing protein [Leadbetterella sp.]|nr:right-handed parallel beta-helix repeat-containing protein [Leadbetterella sp.]
MKQILISLLVLLTVGMAFGQKPVVKIPFEEGKDYTDHIRRVLDENRAGNVILQFEEGVYHFYPEKASGKYIRISNNDNSYKPIAFDLSGMKGLSVRGNRTEFMFHGEIVPFFLEGCKDISLSGIHIDYDFSFIFEGEVMANNPAEKSIDLRISDKFKYHIRGSRFFFGGYNWERSLGENIVFDKKTRAPYYNTNKYNHSNRQSELQVTDLGNRMVRLSGFRNEVPPVGSIYTDKGLHGENRLYPAIIIHNSARIRLEHIQIFMAGAMALIGENSADISMQKFNVCLRSGSGRYISASADATHFVNCRGTIRFEDCLFENMLDDATNIHGVYMKATRVDTHCLSVTFGHFQQEGFLFARKGDTLQIIDQGSLKPLHRLVVKGVEWINENYGLIYSGTPVPESLENTAIENISNMPAMVMKNCTVRNNRARSLLISTPKPVLIENSYFDSMMAGILIAGDANKWFESGRVSDVTIRNNTFVNMGKGGNAPQSVLQISPEIPKDRREENFYHGKIVFENNLVRTFDAQVIYALSVDSLVIRNNRFMQSKDYAPIYPGLPYIDVQYGKNVAVYGNSYEGEGIKEVSALHCETVKLEKQKGFKRTVIEKPNTFFYQQ